VSIPVFHTGRVEEVTISSSSLVEHRLFTSVKMAEYLLSTLSTVLIFVVAFIVMIISSKYLITEMISLFDNEILKT